MKNKKGKQDKEFTCGQWVWCWDNVYTKHTINSIIYHGTSIEMEKKKSICGWN